MKKTTALLLTMAFITCLAPAAAFAEGDTATAVSTGAQVQTCSVMMAGETTGANTEESELLNKAVTLSSSSSSYTVKASGSTAYVGDKLTYTFSTPTSITSVHAFVNGKQVSKTTKYTKSSSSRKWTIQIPCTKKGSYEVQFVAAKNNKGIKLMPSKAYNVTVKAVPNTYQITPSKSTIKVGESVSCKVVTPKTVTKVKFASGSETVDSSSSGKTNSDGTKTWSLDLKFSSSGTKKVTFNAYKSSSVVKTKNYSIPVSKASESTPSATATPKPSATATATAKPSATATPKPSSTPIASASAAATPKPSATATATAKPSSTAKIDEFEMITENVTPNEDGNPTFIISAKSGAKVSLVINDSEGDKVATLLSNEKMEGTRMSAVWRLGKSYVPGKFTAKLTVDDGSDKKATADISFKVNPRTGTESGETDNDAASDNEPDINNDENVNISGEVSAEGKAQIQKLISVAKSKLGYPYVLGGKGPKVFDCSGFVYWALNNSGYSIKYMTSSTWGSLNTYTKINSMKDLRAGDIICFSGHVGISLGDDMMIDASSSDGVIRIAKNISKHSYWISHFKHGCRIFK